MRKSDREQTLTKEVRNKINIGLFTQNRISYIDVINVGMDQCVQFAFHLGFGIKISLRAFSSWSENRDYCAIWRIPCDILCVV